MELRAAELRLIEKLREWAIAHGSREICLAVDYQDSVVVQIRVLENRVKEERLR